MTNSITIRANTTNRGGISRQHDLKSCGWTVLYSAPGTGELILMSVSSDSNKSVRQLLAEIGVDIEDAIVEFLR